MVAARQHPSMGKKIRWYREQRGFTVNGLGRAAGIAASLISRWENGKATPPYDKACLVAETLDIPVEWIWDHGGAPTH